MPKASSPPKRARLTLSQLASHDDILTDALVDNAYYWCRIRKNREKYTPCRRFKKDEIRNILFEEVVMANNPTRAEERLLQLRGISDYLNRWKNNADKEHFKRHMRKYLNIWQTDCPWEVGTTNRYTILTYEAAAFARRQIKKGEIIKYLCGTLVLMTPEEEKQLDVSRTDFSIVRSSRRKASALFLGPARFSNHDCNANATLSTRGSDGMVVVATRNIDLGEEITVTYGEDYFGVDNCECLCNTCEQLHRNGWSATAREASVTDSDVERPYTRELSNSTRSKRSRDSSSVKTPLLSTPDPESILAKRRKLSTSPSTLYQNRSRSAMPAATKKLPSLPRSASLQPFRDRQDAVSDFPDTPSRPVSSFERHANLSEATAGLDISVLDSLGAHSEPKATDDPLPEVPPIQDEPPLPNISHFEPPHLYAQPRLREQGEMSRIASSITSRRSDEVDLIWDPNEQTEVATPPSIHCDSARSSKQGDPASLDVPESRCGHSPLNSNNSLVVSSLASADTVLPTIEPETNLVIMRKEIEEIPVAPGSYNIPDRDNKHLKIASHEFLVDSIGREITHGRRTERDETESELSELGSDEEFDDTRRTIKKRGRLTRAKRAENLLIPSIEEPKDGSGARRPGDYIRTKELLTHPGSIWADCHTCAGTWVQTDAHETHRECPRCERHSIMYGYAWPKTEKKSGDDERVRDHRTINRILGPGEQKGLKRKGRGLGWSPMSSVSRRTTPAQVDELTVPKDGRRRSGRRSRS